MPNPPKKSSAYAEFLYKQIDDYFLKQGSAFTLDELALFCGLKVTTNMRRRVRHAVAEGRLVVQTAYMGRSSHGFVYSLPMQENGSIPF